MQQVTSVNRRNTADEVSNNKRTAEMAAVTQDMDITGEITVQDSEIQCEAVRSQGPGGQNVNKVSSAIHLRFDIIHSSLPDQIRDRLLRMKDKRITREGVVVIKAQRYRSQEKNRVDAVERLKKLILKAMVPEPVRKPTRPSKTAREKRLDEKSRQSRLKQMRKKVSPDE